MVSDLNLNNDENRPQKLKVKVGLIPSLNNILRALEAFKGNYHKKLNYEKLRQYLSLSVQDAHDLLSIVLKFQEVFKDTFSHHYLQKRFIGGITYLIAGEDTKSPQIPEVIHMTPSCGMLLSDIVYTFKHVNRGKGFNLKFANTELLKNIKELKRSYPYFFMENGNNLTYPSETGLLLGEKILSYGKSHKKLTDISLDRTRIIFEDDAHVPTERSL